MSTLSTPKPKTSPVNPFDYRLVTYPFPLHHYLQPIEKAKGLAEIYSLSIGPGFEPGYSVNYLPLSNPHTVEGRS